MAIDTADINTQVKLMLGEMAMAIAALETRNAFLTQQLADAQVRIELLSKEQ